MWTMKIMTIEEVLGQNGMVLPILGQGDTIRKAPNVMLLNKQTSDHYMLWSTQILGIC
ncbi:hypothetical protein HanHA300_Chr02g0043801 [Helianthus annuus]|nr:hypothetical protein HanHA300_Chr02g0043801 [Helianthus annuus]KAJ0617926.1 hypothetical protein HanHA89_Chr02g0047281 [Helianthus annuus]